MEHLDFHSSYNNCFYFYYKDIMKKVIWRAHLTFVSAKLNFGSLIER